MIEIFTNVNLKFTDAVTNTCAIIYLFHPDLSRDTKK